MIYVCQIRVLRSLFPPLILELYRILVAPLGGGRVAAEMVGKQLFNLIIISYGNEFWTEFLWVF